MYGQSVHLATTPRQTDTSRAPAMFQAVTVALVTPVGVYPGWVCPGAPFNVPRGSESLAPRADGLTQDRCQCRQRAGNVGDMGTLCPFCS